MLVTKDTKISKILKENVEAINTIASINKHFLKLKNPILRKVLASRVSVKEAAKIGNTTINDFLRKLEGVGFKVQYDNTSQIIEKQEPTRTEAINAVTFDVRPIIEAGADPFKEIMQRVKNLKEGETLKIINIFEPIPLINILKEKGFKTWTDKVYDNEFHTYFSKETNKSVDEIVKSMPISEGSFDEKLASFGSNIKEIEVRHLEMPEPMVTILADLEELSDNYVLLVNHKKVPQFLLPELQKRAYHWMSKEIELGHILLIIFKV